MRSESSTGSRRARWVHRSNIWARIISVSSCLMGLWRGVLVDKALVTVKATLESEGMKLKGKASKPLPNGSCSEMYVSSECNVVMTQQYQAYIGILRWAFKLGRVAIVFEVSLISSFNALPREGHLEALYQMFAYLAKADQHSIVFDASSPDLKPTSMVATDWTDFYGDVSEAIPPKMPKPRGNPVNTTCFVNANHAGNLVTRRSQTGIPFFLS